MTTNKGHIQQATENYDEEVDALIASIGGDVLLALEQRGWMIVPQPGRRAASDKWPWKGDPASAPSWCRQ